MVMTINGGSRECGIQQRMSLSVFDCLLVVLIGNKFNFDFYAVHIKSMICSLCDF